MKTPTCAAPDCRATPTSIGYCDQHNLFSVLNIKVPAAATRDEKLAASLAANILALTTKAPTDLTVFELCRLAGMARDLATLVSK